METKENEKFQEESDQGYWTEYEDENGRKYYYHYPSGTTTWDLPDDFSVLDKSSQSLIAAPTEKDFQVTAGSAVLWVEVLDENSGQVYFFNENTGETSWERPSEMVLAVGGTEDAFTLDFTVPEVVNMIDAAKGARTIWDRLTSVFPEATSISPLVRINVLEPLADPKPARQRFTRQEADEVDWGTSLVFFAFTEPMPHSERLLVEENAHPRRSRLSMARVKFQRDISKWHAVLSDSFFGFPQHYQGASEFHVDWSSGPDRYMITREILPTMGWKRQFQFYAYAANKFHVLQSLKPVAYKIVKGYYIPAENGWKCLFGFYAFEDQVPGSNKYYVQFQDDPFFRIRMGVARSVHLGWKDCLEFYALDVPIVGTTRISVHYNVRSIDSEDIYPEQHKLALTTHTSGMWEHLFDFYAFPAYSVELCL